MKKLSWYEYLTPLILAIFPIFSLALENYEFISLRSIFRSIIYSLLITVFIYILFNLILKNPRKSGILAGLFILLLLTYGNAYILLKEQLGEAARHSYVIGIYVLIFISFGAYIIYKVKKIKELNLAIFTGGLALTIYLLGSIGLYEFRESQSEKISENSESFSFIQTENGGAILPNIYLILLDGHTRSDVLKNVYAYDNSSFIAQLEELDFWVADCSQSNYPGTKFSMTALFEMDYLHNIYESFANLILPPLNSTSVFQILEKNNYSTITFHNFIFEHFDIRDNINYSKEDNLFGDINEFEGMVVDTSALRILVDMEDIFPENWVRPFKDNFYLTQYRDAIYALDTLPKLLENDLPMFVYAHLLVTHDPFVFNSDGSFRTIRQPFTDNYVYAVDFIDNALPGIVEEIINKSKEPPIIIIMGDHGPTIKGNPIEERITNLFALYFQGTEPEGFYNTITPVNVFRLIFNNMFNANYEFIEDNSYGIWNINDLGKIDNPVLAPCGP